MKVGENTAGAFAGIINSTTEFYLEQGFLDIGDHKGKYFSYDFRAACAINY